MADNNNGPLAPFRRMQFRGSDGQLHPVYDLDGTDKANPKEEAQCSHAAFVFRGDRAMARIPMTKRYIDACMVLGEENVELIFEDE